MQQTTTESAPTESSLPQRKLYGIIGGVLINGKKPAPDLKTLRIIARDYVDAHCAPERGPYRVDVREEGVIDPNRRFQVCHTKNKREHVVGMFRRSTG